MVPMTLRRRNEPRKFVSRFLKSAKIKKDIRLVGAGLKPAPTSFNAFLDEVKNGCH
jgi:hypothetical protein